VVERGEKCPIAFVSKKLNKAQRNYSVIKRFRAYFEGHESTVITDHASLKWLMTQTDLHSRLARWALKLQSFNFKIEHRSGKLNLVPGALSRVNEEEVAALEARHGLLVDLESSQFKDPDYLDLIERVKDNASILPDLKSADGFAFHKTEHTSGEPIHDSFFFKLWIPSGLAPVLLKNAHDDPLASHGCVHKTLERLKRYYYWPGLVKDVK